MVVRDVLTHCPDFVVEVKFDILEKHPKLLILYLMIPLMVDCRVSEGFNT